MVSNSSLVWAALPKPTERVALSTADRLISRVDSGWLTTKRAAMQAPVFGRLDRRQTAEPPGYGSVVRVVHVDRGMHTICAYWPPLCTPFAYPHIVAHCVPPWTSSQVWASTVGIWDWRSFELKSHSKTFQVWMLRRYSCRFSVTNETSPRISSFKRTVCLAA